MREPDNIRAVSAVLPDYMGFIFYPASKRYAGDMPADIRSDIPAFVRKVGVFVDEDEDRLTGICTAYGIGTVQLHGDESPEYCEKIVEEGLRIIKVFRIGKNLDTQKIVPYQESCSYLLFDTDSDAYGGSGEQFDWELLKDYTLEIPFFLSGGIGPEDAEKIRKLAHPMFFGIDINSRFESSPGLKDAGLCERFINAMRTPR